MVDENGTLAVKDKHELQDKILIPPRSEQIPWQMPRASEVLKYVTGDNDAQLFNDLVQYHKSISELPDENHYKFLAAWEMHTYFVGKISILPNPLVVRYSGKRKEPHGKRHHLRILERRIADDCQ